MNHTQPGTYIEHQAMPLAQPEMATAVPLFIGYIERGSAQCLYKIDTFADYLKLDSGAGQGYLYAVLKHYFAVGGAPCFVLSVDNGKPEQPIALDEWGAKMKAAVQSEALSREPTITLMVVPDLALLNERYDGTASMKAALVARWADIYGIVLSMCHQHNWFALLDSPADIELAKALVTYDFATAGEYGAAYWPYLQLNESAPLSAQTPSYLPPSASVAAMIQRIDQARGIWKAPANVALPQVIAPQYDHWSAQGLFNPESSSINLIRSFAGRGVRVWGCRTLARPKQVQRQYIQTRRLLTYIELNLTARARFAIFEPNHEITWIKLKGLTQAWLRQLWFQGGLFGAVEEEAFRVFVGLHETMTQADIQAGKLLMRVCIAPLYPAEFIDITLQFYTNEGGVVDKARQMPQPNRSMSA